MRIAAPDVTLMWRNWRFIG